MGVATDTAVVSGPYFNSNSSNDTNYTVVTIGAAPPPVTNFTVTALASSAFIVWRPPRQRNGSGGLRHECQLWKHFLPVRPLHQPRRPAHRPDARHNILLQRHDMGGGNLLHKRRELRHRGHADSTPLMPFIGSSWSAGLPRNHGNPWSYFNVANTTDQNPTASATYTPTIPAPGLMNVLPGTPNPPVLDQYPNVLLPGRPTRIIASVNQTTNGGSWQPLATNFYFASGTGGNVVIYNDTGETNKQVAANAMKWSYVCTPRIIPPTALSRPGGPLSTLAPTRPPPLPITRLMFCARRRTRRQTPRISGSASRRATLSWSLLRRIKAAALYQLQTSTNLLNSQWVTLTNQPAIGTNATGSFTNGTGYGIFTLTRAQCRPVLFSGCPRR